MNDAGVGRERAGIDALQLLESHRRPAAALSHSTARIGDGNDCARRGIISFVNGIAVDLGVRVGQSASEAAMLMTSGTVTDCVPLDREESTRTSKLACKGSLVLTDSASLLSPEAADAIVITGSHGGLVGGGSANAIKTEARAAVFNDAGGGIDDAGYSRLPVLNARGIPAATVSAWSARIGDAESTLRDGFISRLNVVAMALGCEIGMCVQDFVDRVLENNQGTTR